MLVNEAVEAKTMRAVVFCGAGKVAVERRDVPRVREPTDVVVEVGLTALCGR
jgi:threonine dehydrogenase-like Zn-dependent dehydrogenase